MCLRAAHPLKRQRNFKVYLTNPSLRTALFGPVEIDDAAYGHLVETAVFAQWFHDDMSHLYYARWRSGELDLVSLAPPKERRWAVEVKWSDRAFHDSALVKSALSFCEKNHIDDLTVTTRTLSRTDSIGDRTVRFLPAALYAFTVGYNLIND